MNTCVNLGICLFLFLGGFRTVNNPQKMDYDKLRTKMVVDQIIKRGINDSRVIDAMERVERHLFVPKNLESYAYQDGPLPIGEGQTISQPYIVAFMTAILDLEPQSRVLEIGTGSGYQAAILGELCREVFSIEIVESLQERAERLLDSLGYENVTIVFGDGYLGYEKQAPYDAIIVTCSPTEIPEPLIHQLAEGGRMVIPVGEQSIKKLVLLKKKKGRIVKQSVLPVRFVPMVDKDGESY